jgi:hypothetical protein
MIPTVLSRIGIEVGATLLGIGIKRLISKIVKELELSEVKEATDSITIEDIENVILEVLKKEQVLSKLPRKS